MYIGIYIYIYIIAHVNSLIQSPLHYACSHKRVKKRGSILRVFLYYGGDLYQRDNDGKTPLSVLQEVDGTLYTSIVQDYLCTSE